MAKDWKGYERRICKRTAAFFGFKYEDCYRTPKHIHGVGHIPKGRSDSVKSKKFKKVFPFWMEMKHRPGEWNFPRLFKKGFTNSNLMKYYAQAEATCPHNEIPVVIFRRQPGDVDYILLCEQALFDAYDTDDPEVKINLPLIVRKYFMRQTDGWFIRLNPEEGGKFLILAYGEFLKFWHRFNKDYLGLKYVRRDSHDGRAKKHKKNRR